MVKIYNKRIAPQVLPLGNINDVSAPPDYAMSVVPVGNNMIVEQ